MLAALLERSESRVACLSSKPVTTFYVEVEVEVEVQVQVEGSEMPSVSEMPSEEF